MSVALVRLAGAAPPPAAGAELAADPSLLEALGYRAGHDVLVPPQGGPVFHLRMCVVEGCELALASGGRTLGMCSTCRGRFERSGLASVEQFAARGREPARDKHDSALCRLCRCPGHERAVRADGLCEDHLVDFRCRRAAGGPVPRGGRLTVLGYCGLVGVSALPTLGLCRVDGCLAPIGGAGETLCQGHGLAWRRHCPEQAVRPEAGAQRRWAALASLPQGRWLDLATLVRSFHDELLSGLAKTAEVGGHIAFVDVRAVVNLAARHQVAHLADWGEVGAPKSTGRRAAVCLAVAARRASATPETERASDVWDLQVWRFPRGVLRFGAISQPWLKELTKAFAFADVPTRARSNGGAATARYVDAIGAMSASLARRPDDGCHPGLLTRLDVDRFLDHVLAKENAGDWSPQTRQQLLARARVVLSWGWESGHLDPAHCGFVLDPTFTVRAADVPTRARSGRPRPEEEPGKAYTPSQMKVFVEHLGNVEELSDAKIRAVMEMLIVTGRRPSEICGLRADCLRHDVSEREDGESVRHPQLRYYASKVRRWHTIYVDSETAATLEHLIDDGRRAWPGVPDRELCLFPRRTNNRNGREPVTAGWVGTVFAAWRRLPAIAEALESWEEPARLYDFRHSFAQRHADAGVPIDVLQELMCHAAADSTRHYYEVSRERRRQAVGVMRQFRFDRNGVRLDTAQRDLLDLEYQRAGLAGVAVPLGECNHPSMLRPGDQRCPVRYRCAGCPAFSSSVDRLPELRSYLDELLRSRESIMASDLDEWARQDALPMQEEIDQVERLVARAEELLAQTPADQRAVINDAISVYRGMRDEIRDRAATPVVLRVRAEGPPVNLNPLAARG